MPQHTSLWVLALALWANGFLIMMPWPRVSSCTCSPIWHVNAFPVDHFSRSIAFGKYVNIWVLNSWTFVNEVWRMLGATKFVTDFSLFAALMIQSLVELPVTSLRHFVAPTICPRKYRFLDFSPQSSSSTLLTRSTSSNSRRQRLNLS